MAKHKLDMFGELLPNLDRHNLDFYSTLDEEKQKAFSGVVAMRFMSAVQGEFADWYLVATNERANYGFHHIHAHPELQYKLLASNGHGRATRHNWIPNPKRAKTDDLDDFILRYWPQANRIEIDIILGKFDIDSFADFVDGTGIDSKDAKELKRKFKARGL